MSSPVTAQMPNYWKKPFIPKYLCIYAVGDASLEALWVSSSSEELWTKRKEQYIALLSNITVVLGLVLTTSAVFLTSSPPSPEYIRYDDFVAYVFVYLTFVTATCGVFSGAAVLIAVSGSGTTAEVFREVTHTPLNLYLVLMVLSYPFMMIIHSSILFIISITLACYRSTSTVLKIFTVLMLCMQTFFIPLLLACMTELYDLKQRWQERGQDQSTDN